MRWWDAYCTDLGCVCRKTMILVHLDHRHVSTINFGWESPEFHVRWYGGALDDRTLAEMKGPSRTPQAHFRPLAERASAWPPHAGHDV